MVLLVQMLSRWMTGPLLGMTVENCEIFGAVVGPGVISTSDVQINAL